VHAVLAFLGHAAEGGGRAGMRAHLTR
jgi:hypothetical protein